ncbi:unnamed protein product [Soboliphyme baturini]|uniref:Peptidase A1 domain-containing protein n=1 Tax=Soboliphyme baturini TaxID=241478 RepID=A0A183J7X3_9BILA|nr:unnamed protein product [Soboliphyme baturini]
MPPLAIVCYQQFKSTYWPSYRRVNCWCLVTLASKLERQIELRVSGRLELPVGNRFKFIEREDHLPYEAISDTGSSLIAGPYAAVKTIGQTLNLKYNLSYSLYMVPCDQIDDLPDIYFVINGTRFNLSPQNYVFKVGIYVYKQNVIIFFKHGEVCFLGFSSRKSRSTWIFGDCWIRQYCHIFDLQNKLIKLCPALK